MPDVEDFESTGYYGHYISASLMIPKDDGFARALVTRQKRDLDRNIIGSRLYSPLVDTRI